MICTICAICERNINPTPKIVDELTELSVKFSTTVDELDELSVKFSTTVDELDELSVKFSTTVDELDVLSVEFSTTVDELTEQIFALSQRISIYYHFISHRSGASRIPLPTILTIFKARITILTFQNLSHEWHKRENNHLYKQLINPHTQ